MENEKLDPRLRLMQQAPMDGKVVLLRVDHNVVKKGVMKDPFRIDATFGTLYNIASRGGKPVVLSHIGRPKDKKTGNITCREGESVEPIVQYLRQKLSIDIHVPQFSQDLEKGILHLDASIQPAIKDLKAGKIGMIYLPNSRWFLGEESKGIERKAFAQELAFLADLYVNDAFGSWQAHVSTYDVARLLPAYAGRLLQREIVNLEKVLNPIRPFVGVVAGAKYDTKIGPLKALYEKVDHLILGGLMYNTFISAKYGASIRGVSEEDRALAMELVKIDRKQKKIVEMNFLVESETTEKKAEGQFRTISLAALKNGKAAGYLLDVDPKSYRDEKVSGVIASAGTFFVNAVMGMMPSFWEGSEALYRMIAANRSARKLFAGGDTVQELRNLCPGIYMSGLDDPNTYYFTGGGAVLSAIEQGTPYDMKPIQALFQEI